MNRFRGCSLRLVWTACLLTVLAVSGFAAESWKSSAWGTKKPPAAAPWPDGKLAIIAFGAHPDDCELKAGGVGALWAAQGCHVKFVSTTNGDIGHWSQAGGVLAQRRLAEVRKCDAMLGVTPEVLDIHDGELMPTLENRATFTRLIREWRADIVMGPRPNDYHPDHRYTGILMQDSAFMVTVPFYCANTPYLAKNPVFLYFSDDFQRPNPFRPDIVVSIDEVIEKKVEAIALLESQMLEGCCPGSEALLPTDEEDYKKKSAAVRDRLRSRFAGVANKYRDRLIELYGPEKGKAVKYAEAFELCEYGSRPSIEDLKKLFPTFGK
ncbi:MAG: PIG-L family deacetylase [Candidatus Sumerlaeia bacterium]|nr:PIG-L family deacetylase [Candidatus Sumerlaeia bacterium]